MKKCRTCREKLPPEQFYRQVGNTDGLMGTCKECVKARVRAYRANNLKRVREYDRERGGLPHRKDRVRQNYHRRVSTKEGREKEWARVREEALRHPEQRKARVAVGNAIRDGRLKVQPCERCGYGIGVNAHHEDYSKPLEVVWLCRPCHGVRHREINEERRRSAA